MNKIKSSINNKVVFVFIASLPFLTMFIVNEWPGNKPRTHEYVKEYCTWYCHDVTCQHWKDSYAIEPTRTKRFHKDVFIWYVESLHNNALGLNYGAINLLVYIVLYPLVGSWLLWRLINKLTR